MPNYYDTISWGVSGLGPVSSGGDGSLTFTAYNAAGATIIGPTTSVFQEFPSGTGEYKITLLDYEPTAGDYGVVRDGVLGTGHSVTFTLNPAPVVSGGGGGGSGSGDIAIDHNGGTGVTVDGNASATDCMQITSGGNPVDDAEIVAYLLADYTIGHTGLLFRQGQVRTKDDGRWAEPLMLSGGGIAYTLVVNAQGKVVKLVQIVVA